MAGYDGNGNFFWTYSWVQDAQNGVPITASRMDTQFNDAQSGFDNCITRDAQGVATAIIPFPLGITADTIGELTPNAGVTVGGVLLGGGTSLVKGDSGDGTYGYTGLQKTTGILQTSTTTIFRFLNNAGALIGTNFVAGHIHINVVDEASGNNNASFSYWLGTTGNGTVNSNADDLMLYAAGVAGTPSAVQRGTQLVTSIVLANDGVGGAVKVQLVTATSGKTVTARASFQGIVK